MLDYIANWGGIYGDVTLEAEDHTHIDSVQISSDTDKRIATFRLKLATDAARGYVRARQHSRRSPPINREITIEPDGEAEASIEVPLPNAPIVVSGSSQSAYRKRFNCCAEKTKSIRWSSDSAFAR